jgi:hypothetical protein
MLVVFEEVLLCSWWMVFVGVQLVCVCIGIGVWCGLSEVVISVVRDG